MPNQAMSDHSAAFVMPDRPLLTVAAEQAEALRETLAPAF